MCRWDAEQCDRIESFIIVSVQHTEFRVANPYRVRQHGVENRLKLARRTGNDFQHFGSRRLLLSD